MPWIGHDGYGQPNGTHDHDCSDATVETVETLALAYYLSQNSSYARPAAAALRSWYLAPATRMTPTLEYASVTPGDLQHPNGSSAGAGGSVASSSRPDISPLPSGHSGTSSGIIESSFRWRTRLADSALLLEGADCWRANDTAAMRQWLAAFLDWLVASPQGMAEAHALNNHVTWYWASTISFALYTSNASLAEALAEVSFLLE